MLERLLLDEVLEVLAEHLDRLVTCVRERHLARAVRRQDDILRRPERVALRNRLLGHDVERRAREMPRIERLDERRLVDRIAAADIDDERIFRQHGQALARDHVRRLLRARQAENEDVRLWQVRLELLLLDDRVVDRTALAARAADADDGRRLERLDALRIARADIARADNRHAAALNGAQRQIVLPLVAADEFRILRVAAHEHQRHHDEMLRNRHAVRARRIRQQAAVRQHARLQHRINASRHTAEPLEVRRRLRELRAATRRRRIDDVDIREVRQRLVIRLIICDLHAVLCSRSRYLLTMRIVHKGIHNSDLHEKSPFLSSSFKLPVFYVTFLEFAKTLQKPFPKSKKMLQSYSRTKKISPEKGCLLYLSSGCAAFVVGLAAAPDFLCIDCIEEQSRLQSDLREVCAERADRVVAHHHLDRQDRPVDKVRDVDEDPERPVLVVLEHVEDLRDKADDKVDRVEVRQLTADTREHPPADGPSEKRAEEHFLARARLERMRLLLASPEVPANRLRDDVDDVHRKRAVRMADPRNVRHRHALDKAKDKGNLAPLHAVDEANDTRDARDHADWTVWHDGKDRELQENQDAHVDDLKALPVREELAVEPIVFRHVISPFPCPTGYSAPSAVSRARPVPRGPRC